MKALVISWVALVLAATAAAKAEDAFKRPDCSGFKAEAKCIREIRKSWQDANFAALQKTGLMFIYMARPDPEASPAAKKAIENKIEGSFTVKFSVATDGKVRNVVIENVTEGITPLASLWADTIGQWTFTKVDQPVSDVVYRRIYLYSKEDDERP